MLETTVFKDMLDEKWKGIRPLFYVWCVEYMIFLLCFTSSIALRPSDWHNDYIPSIPVGVLELYVSLHILVSLIIECGPRTPWL